MSEGDSFHIYSITETGNFRVDSIEAYDVLIQQIGEITLAILEERPELEDNGVLVVWLT